MNETPTKIGLERGVKQYSNTNTLGSPENALSFKGIQGI